jgi:hypothetical protein
MKGSSAHLPLQLIQHVIRGCSLYLSLLSPPLPQISPLVCRAPSHLLFWIIENVVFDLAVVVPDAVAALAREGPDDASIPKGEGRRGGGV